MSDVMGSSLGHLGQEAGVSPSIPHQGSNHGEVDSHPGKLGGLGKVPAGSHIWEEKSLARMGVASASARKLGDTYTSV